MSVCPGISSVSYLAARSGNSWQDAKIVSLHGTDQMERLIKTAGMREKVFVITSGVFGRPRNREAADRMWIKRDDCDGRICAVLSGGTDKNIVPGRMYAAYRRGDFIPV